MKRSSSPKKGTAQPCQRGVNVDHEKSLRNCSCDGINIYYDGSQYKDIFYIYEVFDDKYWWVTSYEIVVRIIYLKGLFSHPNVSEFHAIIDR